MDHTQEIIGLAILVPLNIILWLRVGFAQEHNRTKAWMAVVVLYVMWTIHLAALHELTAIAAAVNTVVFAIITAYRQSKERPHSKMGRAYIYLRDISIPGLR